METEEETARVLIEHNRKAKAKQVDIAKIMSKNLGPSGSESVNPSYVENLTRQAIPIRPSPGSTQPMEVEQGGEQPPPGPQGPGGTPIIESVSGGEATGGKAVKMLSVRRTAKGHRLRLSGKPILTS